MSLALAVVAGVLIGLSLGALGGGGSILAVPVLVYLLGQTAVQATTGSLVVVGATSLVGAVAAGRAGNVRAGKGVGFGAVAIVGAVVGAAASTKVPDQVLLAAFAALLLVVAALMVRRGVRQARGPAAPGAREQAAAARPRQQALRAVLAATAVGLLTGFLGVGGGFLVVPALVLVLAMPMEVAAGTSLVVITMTSAAALVTRVGAGVTFDWTPVVLLTVVSSVAAVAGARLASRTSPKTLSTAFTALVVAVAVWTAARALPALM